MSNFFLKIHPNHPNKRLSYLAKIKLVKSMLSSLQVEPLGQSEQLVERAYVRPYTPYVHPRPQVVIVVNSISVAILVVFYLNPSGAWTPCALFTPIISYWLADWVRTLNHNFQYPEHEDWRFLSWEGDIFRSLPEVSTSLKQGPRSTNWGAETHMEENNEHLHNCSIGKYTYIHISHKAIIDEMSLVWSWYLLWLLRLPRFFIHPKICKNSRFKELYSVNLVKKKTLQIFSSFIMFLKTWYTNVYLLCKCATPWIICQHCLQELFLPWCA